MGSDLGGAILAVFAAIASNVGTNSQKKSHLNDENAPISERRVYWLRPLWWFGLVLTILASIGDFLALGIADQALVASLGGGTTLIANVAVAHFWHGDKVYKTDLVGVLFILVGAALFAYTATDSKSPDLSAHDLPHKFVRDWFLGYLGVQTFVMLIFLANIGSSYVSKLRKQWTLSLLSPIMEEIHEQELRIKALERALKTVLQRTDALQHLKLGAKPTARAISRRASMRVLTKNPYAEKNWWEKYIFAACAGTIGGFSVLFGGCTSKMLVAGAVDNPWFYVFLLALLVTLFLQIHFQNRAMQLGETMSVFPVFQAFWITFGVVSGLYFYDLEASWAERFKRVIGIPFMMIGICFLFLHKQRKPQNMSGFTEPLVAAKPSFSCAEDIIHGKAPASEAKQHTTAAIRTSAV